MRKFRWGQGRSFGVEGIEETSKGTPLFEEALGGTTPAPHFSKAIKMSSSQRLSFTAPRAIRVATLSLLCPMLALSSAGCIELDVQPGAGTGDSGTSTSDSGAEPRPDLPGTPVEPDKVAPGDFVTPDPAGLDDEDDSRDKKKRDGKKGRRPERDGSSGMPGGDGGREREDEGEDDEAGDAEEGSDASRDEEKDAGEDSVEPEKKDPGKILKEADVVQVQGDTAYVLSSYSGLHILDLADPANIKILGSKALDGVPFEMYLRDGELLVMNRELYLYDATSKSWKEGSSVLRLGVADPAKIQVFEENRILGRISDSRMVGDRLYVVSYEDGNCFDCDSRSRVRLSSLLAPKGAALSKVDEAVFGEDRSFWKAPSAYFGKDQIFITAPSPRSEVEKGLLFRAKVNDANGDLEPYAPIDVDGRILSRWQINQRNDVLRVFSQGLRFDVEPKLETFKLEDKKATRLAALDVKLPEPEDIKSARFDGDRAYLITFRRTDPLFTFDLSDPVKPKQLGELEIPGWVYHMEPRGNRLIGAGYNVNDRSNRLSLTLFDVSDLAKPKVLSRVSFGGTNVDFAEGQDQIHKSLKFMDDKDLILVPYSVYDRERRGRDEDGDDDSWDPEDSEDREASGRIAASALKSKRQDRDCRNRHTSAVQLFDWTDEEIKVRGKAPAAAGARRTLLHRDRLLAISDSGVSSYDIQDRDNPKLLSKKEIALFASDLEALGDYAVRLSTGWFGQGKQLEVVKKTEMDKLGAVSSIPLSSLNPDSCKDARYLRVKELFAHGKHLYVLFHDHMGRWSDSKVAVVNLSDPANPKVIGTRAIERSYGRPDSILGEFRVRSRTFGVVGDRVVVATIQEDWDRVQRREVTKTIFTVLRVDPSEGLVEEVSLDRENTHYAGGLIPAGQELGSWHARKTDLEGQLKFYYDRFFIDAAGRFQHKAINVPGVPMGRESTHKRLMTMNFSLDRVDSDPASCKKHVKYHAWDWKNSKCVLLNTALTQVELSDTAVTKIVNETDLAGPQYAQRLAFLHEDRVFSTAHAPNAEGGVRAVAALDAEGTLRQARFESSQTPKGLEPLNGAQAIETISRAQVAVLDGRSVDALGRRLYKAPHHWCRSPLAHDKALYCALGMFGVRQVQPE